MGGIMFPPEGNPKYQAACVEAYAFELNEMGWEHRGAWDQWLATVKPGQDVTVLCERVRSTYFGGALLSHCFGGEEAQRRAQ